MISLYYIYFIAITIPYKILYIISAIWPEKLVCK